MKKEYRELINDIYFIAKGLKLDGYAKNNPTVNKLFLNSFKLKNKFYNSSKKVNFKLLNLKEELKDIKRIKEGR